MRADLDIAFRDVAADQLCFRTDAPPLPALAALRVETLGGWLELHLLGASHQAILRAHGVTVNELVACGMGTPGLPAQVQRAVGPLSCRFEAHIRSGGAAEHATRLRTRFGDDAAALVGEFPGSPDALTVLVAEARPDRCRWRTWHVYPQSDQVAITTTVVTPVNAVTSGGHP